MKLGRLMAAAAFMAVSGIANAMSLTGGTAAPLSGDQLLQQAQYRECHRSPYGGWVRYNRYGEPVPCRPHYRERHCTKDWHCEKSGPLGLNKRCYWRDICN